MKNRSIYTLGTDLRSAEDFIEVLLAYEIRTVIDVRSFPKSRMSHFSKDPLAELLKSNGIAYNFFGKELAASEKEDMLLISQQKNFQMGLEWSSLLLKKLSLLLSARKNFRGSATENGYPGSYSTGDGLSSTSLTKVKSGTQNRPKINIRFSNI